MTKQINPPLKEPPERENNAAGDPPITSPMSREARRTLMRERHMGTAKVNVVELELAISLSRQGVGKEVEDRLKARQGQGMTTTPIDPFELEERLRAAGLKVPTQASLALPTDLNPLTEPEPMIIENEDDQVADATKRVNTAALMAHLNAQQIDYGAAPLTMPIELDDLIELKSASLLPPPSPRPAALMTMRLDENDLEVLEERAATPPELPLLPVELELLPETTKLDRSSLQRAVSGVSATSTGNLPVVEVPLPIISRRTPVQLEVKPYLEALEAVQEATKAPKVLPGVPKNFGVEQIGVPQTPEQLQTERFSLDQLPGVGITPQATPPTLKGPHPDRPLFTPLSASTPKKAKRRAGLPTPIVFVFLALMCSIGALLAWMLVQ